MMPPVLLLEDGLIPYGITPPPPLPEAPLRQVRLHLFLPFPPLMAVLSMNMILYVYWWS